MKYLSTVTLAAAFAAVLAFATLPAQAQQAQLKPASPTAIAAAKEILTMKNVSSQYANAVPSVIQRTKDAILASNLSYQKDLNEVAVTLVQTNAGREKEIFEQMAKIYASDFTEQELKDLVTFYKSPLGQKLLTQEPKTIFASINYMNQWAQGFAADVGNQFSAEMKKRGKPL
jgi:hypothetical protein